jgi:hypothetical protein
MSQGLFLNIAVSEMMHIANTTIPDIMSLWDVTKELYFISGNHSTNQHVNRLSSGMGLQLVAAYPDWNRYTDPLMNTYAKYNNPLLLLNGDLDPNTPQVCLHQNVKFLKYSKLELFDSLLKSNSSIRIVFDFCLID